MKYRMIQRGRESFSIRMMCRCLRVSPSGYYGWATRPPSPRAQANAQLLTQIRQRHADQDGVVGSQRIWEDLRDAGERCGRHRVARLMRRAGLPGVPQRRRWRMKRTGVRPAGTQNHLNRDVTAAAPTTKWVTDSTDIRTAEHWLYLCVVLDLYSGLVVGWSMSPQQDRQTRHPGGVDGGGAAARPHAGHSALGSRLSVLPPRNTSGSWKHTRSSVVGVRWGAARITRQPSASSACSNENG